MVVFNVEHHPGSLIKVNIFQSLFKNIKLDNEIIVQLEDKVCSIETCNVCSNNEYTIVEDNDRLIDLRLIKKSHQIINEKQKRFTWIGCFEI